MAEATGSGDSNAYLDSQYCGVSIWALRMSSRKKLGMYLNLESQIPLPNGLLPNFEGLAELIGFDFLEQQNFQRGRDPTGILLLEWGSRSELTPTLGKLVEFLQQLERFDVLEDCKEIIRNDAEHFLRKKTASEITPVQDCTVSQSSFNIDDMKVDETTIITIQDVESGGPTYYDAFVCYHPEGEDLEFVKEMIKRMECPEHKLKLFVPHRDDLPGASKHVISAKLIQDRCKRMVIVMSPRYLQSDACDFQTKFAHALAPGSRSKKLVPVLISPCESPNILRHVTMCDYTRGDLTGWFWDRLIKSLQAPLNPTDIHIENPSSLSDLKMKIEAQSPTFSPSSPPSFMINPAASLPETVSSGLAGREINTHSQPLSLGRETPPPTEVAVSNTAVYSVSAPVTLLLNTSAPSSPNSQRKNGPKKKDLKSKFRSVFSSHSSQV